MYIYAEKGIKVILKKDCFSVVVNWYTWLWIKLPDLLCHVLADIQQKHTSKPKEPAACIYGDNIRCLKGGVSRYGEQFFDIWT